MSVKCEHLETTNVVTKMDLSTGIAEAEETCTSCNKVLRTKKFSGVEWINQEEVLDTIEQHLKSEK